MVFNLFLSLILGVVIGYIFRKSFTILFLFFIILAVSTILSEDVRIIMINWSGLEEVIGSLIGDFNIRKFINNLLSWFNQSIVIILGFIPGFLLGMLRS